MKKTYIIPEEKIVSVQAESFLADSGEGGVDDGGKTGRSYDAGDASYTKGEAGWASGW